MITEIVYGNTPDGIVLLGMALAIAGVAIVNAAPQISDWLTNGRRLGWSKAP